MCQACSIDVSKSEEFSKRMLDIINGGSLAFMISIGHRTGLFDTMSALDFATARDIAAAAGLNERYVREWLGAMVTGRIVEADEHGARFRLPAEHAAFLTRAAGADNMAVTLQFMAVMGSVEDEIVECFKKGGGVPYSRYKRFHAVMAEESTGTVVGALLDFILPTVPGIKERLAEGIDVLDIGCGSGRALNFLARNFPKSRFVGYDLSEEAISIARGEAEAAGLTNLRFEVRDLSTFDEDAPAGWFDLVTSFDAIHDQAWPNRVLAGINRALKHDGVYLMQDISTSSNVTKNLEHPIGPMIYTISCMHCMTVSLAQGGMGLGAAWGRELAKAMLTDAGFGSVEIQDLEHDFLNCYYVSRKSA